MATPQKQAARPPAKPAGRPAPTPTKPTAAPARPAAPAAKAPTPPPKPTTAVVERPSTAVAARANVPDYIRQDGATRGSENVEMADMIIPRIELVQALSECLKEGSGDYIEGAKAGMFYNSVTRELYGERVVVCPAFFKKQYLAWRDRKKGGGFGGAFDTLEECNARIAEQENPDEWEAIETAQQIVLVVQQDEDSGEYLTSEAVVSCARTKMKISRQWNSLIRINGMDRFSRIYELFGTDETNSTNDAYKNFGVRYIDFAPMSVYKAGEALYNGIASGEIKYKVDDSYIDAESSPSETATDAGPKEY